MDAAEYERRHQRLHALAEFFRANEGRWIEARDFETIAGRQGWRTRISECRTKLGMHIENHQTRTGAEGLAVISRYRYLPHAPLGRDASTQMPTYQPELFIR